MTTETNTEHTYDTLSGKSNKELTSIKEVLLGKLYDANRGKDMAVKSIVELNESIKKEERDTKLTEQSIDGLSQLLLEAKKTRRDWEGYLEECKKALTGERGKLTRVQKAVTQAHLDIDSHQEKVKELKNNIISLQGMVELEEK